MFRPLSRPTTNKNRRAAVVALVCAAVCPATLSAHHSTAEYDSTKLVEAQGVVTKVLWQNPHVRIEVSTLQAAGTPRAADDFCMGVRDENDS